MKYNEIQGLPPSSCEEILREAIGKEVVRLVRFSWWRKEDVAAECNVKNEQAFSLTAGPLALYFRDGSILGVASDPSLNSVVVWRDRAAGQSISRSDLEEDDELFPIESSDVEFSTRFWTRFCQLEFCGVSLLKNKLQSPHEQELPSEVGLCFHFKGNVNFVASHGLHNGSDDFSVLSRDQIHVSLRDRLEELPLF